MSPPEEKDRTPHEFIDAELSIIGLKTPADEEALNAAISKLDGIQKIAIAEGKLILEYEPVRITRSQISAAVAVAGYRVAEVESAPASAVTDAFHSNQ